MFHWERAYDHPLFWSSVVPIKLGLPCRTNFHPACHRGRWRSTVRTYHHRRFKGQAKEGTLGYRPDTPTEIQQHPLYLQGSQNPISSRSQQQHKLRPKWEHVTSLSTQPPFTNASASCSQITPPADSSWHLRCHSGHAHAEPVSPGGSRDQQRYTLALMRTPLSRLQLSLEGAVSIRRRAGWLLPSKPASPNGPVRRAPRTPWRAGRRGTPWSPGASPSREGRILGGKRG